MADRPRIGRPRRSLAARLAREARAGRPPFSAALQERVCAAVEHAREPRVPVAAAMDPAPHLVGMAAAVCVAALVAGAWWPAPRRPVSQGDAVAAAEVPGIERLPTPAEIGEGVLAEVTTLAAAAVGVPEFAELAAFAPAELAAIDGKGP